MEPKVDVKRWQDWANIVLGAWLFISPWVMEYPADVTSAAWNAHFFGAVILIFAAIAMYMPRLWEEGLNIVLGIWVIVSPWVLGFSSFKGVTNNTVIVGILVAVFAALAIAHDREVKNMATGI